MSSSTIDRLPRLSVIVITRNEAAHIRRCLESVAFADEIVVVDSGSEDDTVTIAQSCGARVVTHADWPGFGPQKNRALDLARGEWVLSIDADETVTPALAEQIQGVLAAPACAGYDIPRLSNFCGRYMRHGGWWPDRVLRLFRRDAGRFTDARVHEKVIVQGRVGHLQAHFLHDTHPDLDGALAKMNRYSTDGAMAAHARGKSAGMASALGHGAWAFLRMYVLRRGFLDGRHGFVLACVTAMGTFSRYAKLMFMDQTPPGDGGGKHDGRS